VLETLTYDQMKALVGSTFHIVDSEKTADLQLVTAAKVMESEAAKLKRNAFSLFFLGPHEPFFEQRIYPLDHETLGRMELFIVPVGHDQHGILYEAVFT
jgi:hypothetical protein